MEAMFPGSTAAPGLKSHPDDVGNPDDNVVDPGSDSDLDAGPSAGPPPADEDQYADLDIRMNKLPPGRHTGPKGVIADYKRAQRHVEMDRLKAKEIRARQLRVKAFGDQKFEAQPDSTDADPTVEAANKVRIPLCLGHMHD